MAALADQDAFGTFFDRNHERILAYFYRRTFCPHTSSDLIVSVGGPERREPPADC